MIFRSAVSVRARLIIAALAVCSVALAGCQGGDATGSPENTATTTAAATSSATPTPTPSPTPSGVYKPADASGKAQNVPVPAKPPLADENSKEGLEAFTKYWFELLSYGYETGDLTVWSALSGQNCVFCARLEDGVDESFADGGWQVGGLFETPSAEVAINPATTSQNVLVQVIQQPTQYFKSDGSQSVPADPAGNSAVAVVATHKTGAWFVDDMHPLR